MNPFKSYYKVAKHTSTSWEVNPRLTSVRCMLRFAHSPLNTSTKSHLICVCGDNETELHLFFYCKIHDAAHAMLCNKVCNILTDNKLAEHFNYLSNVELLLRFVFGLSEEPTQASVAVFCAVDEEFWQAPRNTVHHLCVIRTFLLYFTYISSSWQDTIVVIRLKAVAKLSLNK